MILILKNVILDSSFYLPKKAVGFYLALFNDFRHFYLSIMLVFPCPI